MTHISLHNVALGKRCLTSRDTTTAHQIKTCCVYKSLVCKMYMPQVRLEKMALFI